MLTNIGIIDTKGLVYPNTNDIIIIVLNDNYINSLLRTHQRVLINF